MGHKKVMLALERTFIGWKRYYIVINEAFYIKVSKRIWYELAKFLKIDVNWHKKFR